MAKTKFLSKALAVLMALSMLCSTGVFADYNSGLLAGDAAVTGEITNIAIMLNDKINLNQATSVELAKWASTDEGIKIELSGKTSAQTGTLTYLIAPVDTLAAVPLDVEAMEAQSLAIGATEFTGGEFAVTIEVDKAKIVKDTTYELRFAYSKTEIADVTDASALVYQRYIKTYDWADGNKATRTFTKEGIGEVTFTIEGNPIRAAAIAANNSNNAQANAQRDSILHIRSANLQEGTLLSFGTSARVPAGYTFVGETSATATAKSRESAIYNVGSKLQGAIVLAQGTGEIGYYFPDPAKATEKYGYSQQGNVGWRFTVSHSGTAYYVTNDAGVAAQSDWVAVEGTGTPTGTYNFSNRNYFYVTGPISDETLAGATIGAYLKANTSAISKEATAPGYYVGAGSKWANTDTTYYSADTAYVNGAGYFQVPAANLDENGKWIMGDNKPYGAGVITNYGYTDGRGWLTQVRQQAYTYKLDFEAGDVIEVPYGSALSQTTKPFIAVQLDKPKAPLASATVSTTKTAYDIDAGLTTWTDNTVTFTGTEYVINVPRATDTATFTVTDTNGTESDAITVEMNAHEQTVTATIGDHTYDVTVKYDAEYPSIFDLGYGKQYDGNKRITVQYGDLNTTSSLKFTAAKTNITSSVPLKDVAFAGGATRPAANKNLVVIGTPSANAGMSHMRTSLFTWMYDTTDNGTTFKVSAPATVYAKSVAYGDVAWPAIEALGWEVVGTFAGYPLYAKHFNAGDTVQIPTQPITQAELDAKNEALAGKSLAFAPITADNQSKNVATGTKGNVGDVIRWNIDENGEIIESAPLSAELDPNVSKDNYGYSCFYTRDANTAFYVEFDQPAALNTLSYTIGAGDAQAIELSADATEATVEVPFGTTDAIALAATMSGTGSIEVSDPITLDVDNQSAAITATLKDASDAVVATYTITFVWGAPGKSVLAWESAIAPTGTLKTQSQGANRNLYANGLYNIGTKSGELELDPENTEVNLVVPYGVEAVKLNGGAKIDLLSAPGHTATTTISVNLVEYTVTISWDAYRYVEGMPYVYDLEYGVAGRESLYTTDRYYVIPTDLVLDAEHDYVYGTGTLKGTNGTDRETVTLTVEEGKWFTEASHKKANLTTTNNGSQINRLHLAPMAFESWVASGDLDNKYALNGATMLVADYNDVVANNAMRYKFKTAIDGYVIVACYKANANLTAANGWTLLEGNTMKFTNGSTTNASNALQKPPIIDGVEYVNSATSYAGWEGNCNYIYIKKVDADEVIEVKESTVSGEHPPVVIVATADMINERVVAPTLLDSLSYTTALAVTNPEGSAAANARGNNKASLHAGGFYQPTLVNEAVTVEVAEDATTVNVTVPYGSEIVNLAGVDTYEGAVTFEPINLINNNGAVTVIKTVGEVEYTINVAWAAYDDATLGLPEGNLVYDVKYRLKDLTTSAKYYNIIPTRLVLTESRIPAQTVPMYKEDGTLWKAAGKWYVSADINSSATNLIVFGATGGDINRGRTSTITFENWVKSGLITANGVPGAALPEDATAAEIDAITYAAMNGAGILVSAYTDFTNVNTASGVNAAMAPAYSFRVAQDSIIYVGTDSTNIGEGWTEFKNPGTLKGHNRTNEYYYLAVEGEGGEVTYEKSSVKQFCTDDFGTTGANAFYRFARAGEIVTVTPNVNNKNMTPAIFVRPLDFSAIEAPTVTAVSYKIGEGEATAVEFAQDATEATVEVPYGTTDAISASAVITGNGSVAVSDAITLSPADRDGTITVTVNNIFGEAVETYTINVVWGAMPEVDPPALATVTYKIGEGEATAVEFAAEATEATVTVPFGTTDAISVVATIDGEGTATVSDAITLSKADRDGAITITLANVYGVDTAVYTVNFVWGVAPAVEAVTYSTARTLYRGEVVADAEVTAATQTIEVPWGTANVTVSYKLEGADAVALNAVAFADGVATVNVELPEETITLTFEYGAAPAGQYITGLAKYQDNWKDRTFASIGDVDNAVLDAGSKYTNYNGNASTTFFGSYDKVPQSIAQQGHTVVIADAGANKGMAHMAHTNFKYMYNSYPATSGTSEDAWMSFTVAKDGMLYAAAPQYDEVWVELENLGWTVAPYTMTYGSDQRKVYQKRVTAGELVYMPGAQLFEREIEAFNEGREDYIYVKATEEDIAAIEAAIAAMIAEGKLPAEAIKDGGTVVGDYLRKFISEDYDAGEVVMAYGGQNYTFNRNIAGFYVTALDSSAKNKIQFGHYTRPNNTVLFAVADEFVADEAKAPKYTGALTLPADGAIDLTAEKLIYGSATTDEITFAIKSGAEYASIVDGKLVANRAAYVENATVVLTIAQGDVTSEATIAILPVDMANYGFLTIEQAEGLGTVEGKVDGEIVIEDTTDGAMEFPISTLVTLEAIAEEGYEFVYWKRADTNVIYGREAKITIAVPYSLALKAVFKKVAEDTKTVTFLGYQDKVLDSFDLGSTEGETITVPAAPAVFGHSFSHYEAPAWGEWYYGGEELAKTLFAKDVTFRAVYEQDANMAYTLTVVNGTVNGETTATVIYNVDVKVIANAAPEGEKFSHWIDGNGQILSYDEEYKFYMAAADRTVEAIYVPVDDVVAKAPVVTMTVAVVDTTDAAGTWYGLYAERRVPEDIQVTETGIVYGYIGNDRGLTEESYAVTLDNYNGKKTSSYQNNNGQYTIRIQETATRVERGPIWYASTYLIYIDTDGSTKTLYSEKALIWDATVSE